MMGFEKPVSPIYKFKWFFLCLKCDHTEGMQIEAIDWWTIDCLSHSRNIKGLYFSISWKLDTLFDSFLANDM